MGYSLTPRAERVFDQIGAWTEERFGSRQAARYLEQLLGRCRGLAAGAVPHWSCREMLAQDAANDLRFARAGEHLVIFVLRRDSYVILDFIHARMDLGQRLSAMAPPE